MKIYNNQLDVDNTVACEKLSNPNGGPTLTFQNFCQDLSNTDSPVTGDAATGNGHCECPWNSDLNQESDLTHHELFKDTPTVLFFEKKSEIHRNLKIVTVPLKVDLKF